MSTLNSRLETIITKMVRNSSHGDQSSIAVNDGETERIEQAGKRTLEDLLGLIDRNSRKP
ncbi:MAG: hypothetical protein ACFFD4_33770 [Candidatus Odinarchaeota archaeon]